MRRIVLFICVVFVMGNMAKAQEEKFKALFMYNFTKYLEWPADAQKGEFVIGVYGSSPIIEELMIIAQKKSIGNLPIVVKKIDNPEGITECSIIFLPDYRSSKINDITSNIRPEGTLLITDKAGLGKTAGINYVIKDGKQSFEINKANIEEKGIKINSTLLTLGVEIN